MLNIKKFFNLEYYTSELDQFLAEYDESHIKLSASQRAERNKIQLIAKGLRYGSDMEGQSKEQANQEIWEQARFGLRTKI